MEHFFLSSLATSFPSVQFSNSLNKVPNPYGAGVKRQEEEDVLESSSLLKQPEEGLRWISPDFLNCFRKDLSWLEDLEVGNIQDSTKIGEFQEIK